MNDAADALIGRVVAGRYRLVRCVGKGGMGAVYEGFHTQTDKRVAVKVLAQHLSKDLKLIARFRREAMAASRLDHENCVRVYDFGEDEDGTFYIAMEFVDGQGLGTVIRTSGPMAQGRVARVGVQLLSALDAAHATGILHRDLKPQNIMLTRLAGRDDVIKVVDFGIAKFINNSREDQVALTVPGTIFGTPEYMSPEQARGEELDGRSDLYSAATVLWHLLLGRSPFRGQTVRNTLEKVFGEMPPSPRAERPTAGIDEAFEEALLGALRKHRDRRYPDAATFLTVLQPYDLGYGVVDPTPQRAPAPGLAPDGSAPETLAGDDPTDPSLSTISRKTLIGHQAGQTPPAPEPAKHEQGGEQAADEAPVDCESATLVHQPATEPPAPAPPVSAAPPADDDDDLVIPGSVSPGLKGALAAAAGLVVIMGGAALFRYATGPVAGEEQAPEAAVDITAPPPRGYEPDLAAYDEAMKLARSAKSEGYLDLARKQFERAVAQNLDDGAAHQALITVYLEQGEVDLAAAHVRRLEEIDADRYGKQIRFTRVLIDKQRAQQANDDGEPGAAD